MKKDYSAPKAEKIEFNYSESVVACMSNDVRNSALPGSGGWVCACEAESYWMENGVCKRDH